MEVTIQTGHLVKTREKETSKWTLRALQFSSQTGIFTLARFYILYMLICNMYLCEILTMCLSIQKRSLPLSLDRVYKPTMKYVHLTISRLDQLVGLYTILTSHPVILFSTFLGPYLWKDEGKSLEVVLSCSEESE